MNLQKSLFELGYELSPIILTNGIASTIPGGMLPIIAITEAGNFVSGLLTGRTDLNPDNFFARFMPVPGGTLINNQIGNYPFANQTVAANAIIAQPQNVSLKMYCPVREKFGYTNKLLTFQALISTLQKHNASGGTYTIATPAYLYTNCIMTGLKDVSDGASKQAQMAWQFDFQQPLITLDDANTALNSLMNKLQNGLPTSSSPSWSGLASSVGATVSGAASSVVNSAKNLIGISAQ